MLENSYLFQEIYQQPETLNRLLTKEKIVIEGLAAAIKQRGITHVIIAGRGTSDNAGRYAQYLLGAVNRLMVTLTTPSLFSIYQQPPQFGNALVLGISQSGQSPDIVSVLAEARRQGALTAAITNFPDSNLANQAEYVINLQAGLEQSLAATKTYTNQLAAIALLSVTLAQDKTNIATLAAIPQAISETLALNDRIASIAQRYRYMQACVIIGRGYNYATAFELALKMKELTYTIAEPYSSADFMHGPLALVEPGFPVLVITPSGTMQPEIVKAIRTLQERKAELLIISDSQDVLDMAHIPIQLPHPVPEWLSPLTAIIPGQLLAMHLAEARSYDIDQPRGLRKVTETI
ncbi:MAG: SIS domain-containing protein [Chloroflexota bacterium]